MLMAAERDWINIAGSGPDNRPSIPCPLAFTEEGMTHPKEDELMERVLNETGAYGGWDGWVNLVTLKE